MYDYNQLGPDLQKYFQDGRTSGYIKSINFVVLNTMLYFLFRFWIAQLFLVRIILTLRII